MFVFVQVILKSCGAIAQLLPASSRFRGATKYYAAYWMKEKKPLQKARTTAYKSHVVPPQFIPQSRTSTTLSKKCRADITVCPSPPTLFISGRHSRTYSKTSCRTSHHPVAFCMPYRFLLASVIVFNVLKSPYYALYHTDLGLSRPIFLFY